MHVDDKYSNIQNRQLIEESELICFIKYNL